MSEVQTLRQKKGKEKLEKKKKKKKNERTPRHFIWPCTDLGSQHTAHLLAVGVRRRMGNNETELNLFFSCI